MKSIWNDENKAFFASIVPGHEEREIRQLFFDKYGITLSEGQIGNMKKKLGVKSGTHGGRFKKGQVSPTKGRKQSEWMSPEAIERTKATRFKKGQMPINSRPLGSEWVDPKDGRIYVKVKEGTRKRFSKDGMWKPRSHIVFEQAYGRPVKEGHKLVHYNGITDDDRIENLAEVPESQHVKINSLGAVYADKETYEMLAEIVEVKKMIAEKRRSAKCH